LSAAARDRERDRDHSGENAGKKRNQEVGPGWEKEDDARSRLEARAELGRDARCPLVECGVAQRRERREIACEVRIGNVGCKLFAQLK
jgi:hypothetical protein